MMMIAPPRLRAPVAASIYHFPECTFDLSYAEPPSTADIFSYFEGTCELFIIVLCCSDGYAYPYAY